MTKRKPKQPSVRLEEHLIRGRWKAVGITRDGIGFKGMARVLKVDGASDWVDCRVSEYRRVPTKRPKARRKA